MNYNNETTYQIQDKKMLMFCQPPSLLRNEFDPYQSH